MEEASCIDYLSDEMLLNIFQYLTDLKDLLTLRLVNKRIASVAMDNVFTQHVVVTRRYHVTTGMLNSFISPVADKINSLDLNLCYWIELKDLNCLLSCKNLHTLHMLQVRVDEVFLCDILTHLPNLTSLSFSITHIGKLQHQLSLCQAARDCLSRIRRLGLHFCYHSQYMPDLSLESGDGARFMQNFKCLEEVHVYGSLYSPCKARSFYIMPDVMDASIFSNLKVMSLKYSNDTRATSFFFGILRHVCKGQVQLNTLLQPSYRLNCEWRADDYNMSVKNMSTLIHLDIFGTNMAIPSEFFNLVTARNLVYLNLSGNSQISSESLKFLSQSCPQLVSVNLQCCRYIFYQSADPFLEPDENNPLVKDLTGIESLVLNCIQLKNLNISAAHLHPPELGSKPFKTLSQILALKPNWHSLAFSPCCLFADDNNLNRDRQDPDDIGRCSVCHLPLTERLNPSAPSCTCISTQAALDLERLIRATPDMKNFELCCPDYPSAFFYGLHLPFDVFSDCLNKTLSDCELACTSAWTKLTSLQLTGIEGVDLGVLLWALSKSCLSLEKLSISCYSSDRVRLDITSYPSFSRLRDFRIQHPYLSANKYLVSSLAQCPNIERICIVSKIARFNADAIKQLFEVSTNLICFQLYSLAPAEECQNLQDFLVERYSRYRPALRVCIQDAMIKDIHQIVRDTLPEIHIDEMTILQSSVAAVPP
ncbi:uncharacterized protein LOC106060792 [Biomphalaria glabrata]|uniref:Uncharacterized protein LOC106060792 n=1 Tax=Biomphalaria glabrata TaxID=6526 RepID=A0A9U8E635_BIOGL|nr:uncharacterized protein LOC106060792 [Biomphalaria glabrata]